MEQAFLPSLSCFCDAAQDNIYSGENPPCNNEAQCIYSLGYLCRHMTEKKNMFSAAFQHSRAFVKTSIVSSLKDNAHAVIVQPLL